jgi:hypothetical protein
MLPFQSSYLPYVFLELQRIADLSNNPDTCPTLEKIKILLYAWLPTVPKPD